jgi:hypothetical protein
MFAFKFHLRKIKAKKSGGRFSFNDHLTWNERNIILNI